jgi:hypothetical protein
MHEGLQEEAENFKERGRDLYEYKMDNIVEKHFSINVAPVRNRGGSLVMNNTII